MHRTFRRGAAIMSGLALAALALTGCSRGDAAQSANADCDKTYTVAFSNPFSEAASVAAIKQFTKDRAEELGCVNMLLDNTTGASLESQRAAVEGWITQQVDAIVILPVDPTAFSGLQHQAQAQGIKWLTYSSQMDGQDGSVGFDSFEGGRLIADDMAKWIKATHPDGDISAAVTTLSSSPGFRGRSEVPIAKLKELGVPVVSTQDCAAQDCGLQIAEDALREHPNLRVFIGLNDDAGVGALRAFKNAGIDPATVYIAGADGSEEALKAIKEGTAYKASAAWPLKELGDAIVDLSLEAIKGDGSADQALHHVLVTPDTPEKADQLLKAFKQ